MSAIEAQGFSPLVPFFDAIDALTSDPSVLFDMVATLHSYGISAFWSFSVQIDPGVPTTNIATLGQGGLSLPDVSMYLDADSAELRTQYAQHISNMFQLIGWTKSNADNAANAVLFVETGLAKITLSPDELTDPFETYNPMSVDKLSTLAPLPWKVYFYGLGTDVPNVDKVTLDVPIFFGNLSQLLFDTEAYWIPYLQCVETTLLC